MTGLDTNDEGTTTSTSSGPTPSEPRPATTRPGRGRRHNLTTGIAAVVMVVGFVACIAQSGDTPSSSTPSSGPLTPDSRMAADHRQETLIARTFGIFYAVHDPRVCALASAELVAQLGREGRCRGPVPPETAQLVDTIAARISPDHTDRADVVLCLEPVGEFGTSYVSVELGRTAGRWRVRAIQPLAEQHRSETRTTS